MIYIYMYIYTYIFTKRTTIIDQVFHHFLMCIEHTTKFYFNIFLYLCFTINENIMENR
jgi:hypothetical protein